MPAGLFWRWLVLVGYLGIRVLSLFIFRIRKCRPIFRQARETLYIIKNFIARAHIFSLVRSFLNVRFLMTREIF